MKSSHKWWQTMECVCIYYGKFKDRNTNLNGTGLWLRVTQGYKYLSHTHVYHTSLHKCIYYTTVMAHREACNTTPVLARYM